MAWNLEGTYLESCNCEAICPCIVFSPPTKGECKVLVAWNIDRGQDGAVKLDGLNVVMLAHAPGNMQDGNWRAALYVDQRATEEQKGSLIKIFGGQAGGHPAALAPLISEMVGVKSAKIDFVKDGKKYRLAIPDVANTELEPVAGPGGGEVTVSGHPFAVSPGVPAVVARSTRSRVKDHGWDWTLDGGQCMHSPFAYKGEA